MSVVSCEKIERRGFPRIRVQCLIHYLTKDGGAWSEATLEDYSASGVSFYSNETLSRNSKITIQITRDASPTVPALSASAIVLRSDQDDGSQYRIACKLTRIRDESSIKHDYLRR